MRIALFFVVVAVVGYRTRSKCFCCVNSRSCSANCFSCKVQRKDNNENKDMKETKDAVRCRIYEILVYKCSNDTDKLDCCCIAGCKPKNEEVKIRKKRSIIRVPKIRRGNVFGKKKRPFNLSRRAFYDGKLS